jgi:hypothetical protein
MWRKESSISLFTLLYFHLLPLPGNTSTDFRNSWSLHTWERMFSLFCHPIEIIWKSKNIKSPKPPLKISRGVMEFFIKCLLFNIFHLPSRRPFGPILQLQSS